MNQMYIQIYRDFLYTRYRFYRDDSGLVYMFGKAIRNRAYLGKSSYGEFKEVDEFIETYFDRNKHYEHQEDTDDKRINQKDST